MAVRYRTWVNNTSPAINANNLNAIEDRLPHISVKDKSLTGGGAVGDGTTDDTTSIQSAFNTAGAMSPPGTVYFPEGVYKITSALTLPAVAPGIWVIGAGREGTVIEQSANNTQILKFADAFTHSVKIANLQLRYATQQTGSHPNSSGIFHPDTDTFGHVIDNVRIVGAYNAINLDQAGSTNTMWGTTLRNIFIGKCANSAIVWKSPVANGMPGNLLDHLYVDQIGVTPAGPCLDINLMPTFCARQLDIEDWRNTIIRTGSDVGMPYVFDGVYMERHEVTSGASRVLFDMGNGGIFRSVAIDCLGDVGVGNTLTLWKTSWPYSHLSVEGVAFNQLAVTNGTIHVYDYTGDFSDIEDGARGARAYFRGINDENLTAVVLPFESTATTKAKASLKEWNGEFYNARLGAGAYLQFNEITAPGAPAANKARLFVEDNGAGKTRLVVRFPTGANQVIATEP